MMVDLSLSFLFCEYLLYIFLCVYTFRIIQQLPLSVVLFSVVSFAHSQPWYKNIKCKIPEINNSCFKLQIASCSEQQNEILYLPDPSCPGCESSLFSSVSTCVCAICILVTQQLYYQKVSSSQKLCHNAYISFTLLHLIAQVLQHLTVPQQKR